MNAERDPFILKLPPEVASHIFFLLMGERDTQDVCQRCTRPPMPFLLGAVCGGWRALARSTPALWSTLVYTSEHNTSLENKKNTPHLIADWLLCSGGLPLTLRISYDPIGEGYNGYIYPTEYDNGWRLIIDTLNLHSERWCEVEFRLPTHYISALRGTSPPKDLRKLKFTNLNAYYPVDFFLQFTMNTGPSPMTVTISGFHLENINISWGNVVHLDLSYTSLDGVMKVLRDAPLLEKCSLLEIAPTPAGGTPRTIIRHSHIRVLVVSSMDIEIFAELLDWLVLPSLEFFELSLHGGDNKLPFDTARSLIERSACSLKILGIWYHGLEYSGGDEQAPMREDMERLLRTVPHLRYKLGVHGLTCFW